MTRAMMITALFTLLAACSSAAQRSTFSDFEDFVDTMEGRWVGEVTWITDWPGLGQKGDKTTGHTEMRSAADGRVLIASFYGGNGTSRWVTVFDAASGEIRELGSDSGGTIWECVMSRSSGQWMSRCNGSLADGTRTVGEHTLAVSDNGNTHRWRGSNTVGGVETDPLQDVWRRVSR